MIEFKIHKNDYTKFASQSLVGILLTEFREQMLAKEPIKLLFERSSMSQLRKNGGPEEILILEYNVQCLVESALWLSQNGYQVEVGHFEVGGISEHQHSELSVSELEKLGSASTEEEWNSACDAVKDARGGGYPSDWCARVINTGLMGRALGWS